jgi:hypothetical protein
MRPLSPNVIRQPMSKTMMMRYLPSFICLTPAIPDGFVKRPDFARLACGLFTKPSPIQGACDFL